MTMDRRSCLATALLLAPPLARNAFAAPGDNYPGDRPIKLVVGYAPGGGNDIAARLLANAIGPALKGTFVVENKAGAGTNIGASYVAHSPPDGYTLSLSSTALAVNKSLYKKLDYDPQKDFEPIALAGEAPNLLLVNPKLPVNSVQEFIAYAKKNPGKLNFTSAGTGSTQHLSGELFKIKCGIEATHVPYKGSAPALAAVISGEGDFSFVNIPSSKQFLEGKQLKALAITSAKRFAAVPDIPTMAEAGVQGMEVATWYSILAPAGTPRPIIDKLNKAINQAVEGAELKKRFIDEGIAPLTGTPEFFKKFLADEITRWKVVVEQSHATAD